MNFSKGKIISKYLEVTIISESIEWYTRAIIIDPTNGFYFGNRSAAYFMLSDFENSLSDSLKVIIYSYITVTRIRPTKCQKLS